MPGVVPHVLTFVSKICTYILFTYFSTKNKHHCLTRYCKLICLTRSPTPREIFFIFYYIFIYFSYRSFYESTRCRHWGIANVHIQGITLLRLEAQAHTIFCLPYILSTLFCIWLALVYFVCSIYLTAVVYIYCISDSKWVLIGHPKSSLSA